MAVEEPEIGTVYRVTIHPGCDGETTCHPARPFAHGHDWFMLGWLPHPYGPHKLRGMDITESTNPIYYLAPSEIEHGARR